MIVVIGSLAVLFAIALIKQIPFIGGNIAVALVGGGLTAALLSGMAPVGYVTATFEGIDKLAWVIALSVFGSIYAETQVRIGAMNTALSFFQTIFGNSPRGLIAATFVTLTLAGSLFGDAIAAATVIGFLVIHSLAAMNLKPVQIAMIILLGASIGSLMPPISQAVYLSASLIETDPMPVTLITYATVTIGLVFAIFESFRFVPRHASSTAWMTNGFGSGAGRRGDLEQASTSGLPEPHADAHRGRWGRLAELIKKRWTTMLPLGVLAFIVILKTGFSYDIFLEIPGIRDVTQALLAIPILQGIAFPVVLAIIVATLIAYLFPQVRRAPIDTMFTGLKNVRQTIVIQLCAGFLVGCFYESGAIDTVGAFVADVAGAGIAVIATLALAALGMMLGSQTAAQTIVVPFTAPLLENAGGESINIAVGMSHIAAGAQNLPPVGLTVFVVCGLVGTTLKTKVDPVKTMILALPNSLYFILLGFGFLLFG